MLCIGAECLSRITDYTDRGTCILLADAAGAAVLRASDGDAGILDTDLYSDGRYGELLIQPAGGSRNPATHETVDKRMHYARMKGNEVFKVAVRMFGDCRRAHPRPERVHRRRPRALRPAPGQPPHHRGGREAAQAADGSRDRQRGPLRQYRRRLGVRRPRGGVGREAAQAGRPRADGGFRRRLHLGRGAACAGSGR